MLTRFSDIVMSLLLFVVLIGILSTFYSRKPINLRTDVEASFEMEYIDVILSIDDPDNINPDIFVVIGLDTTQPGEGCIPVEFRIPRDTRFIKVLAKNRDGLSILNTIHELSP